MLGELEVRNAKLGSRILRDWMACGQHLSRMRANSAIAKHLEHRTRLDGEYGNTAVNVSGDGGRNAGGFF